MSKKARRQRRVNLPPEAFNNPAAAPIPRIGADAPAPAGSAARAAAPAAYMPNGRVPTEINWQEEYGEVLGDLKRTGILAAILMAAMFALSFIIR
jgi:hypothetical protein